MKAMPSVTEPQALPSPSEQPPPPSRMQEVSPPAGRLLLPPVCLFSEQETVWQRFKVLLVEKVGEVFLSLSAPPNPSSTILGPNSLSSPFPPLPHTSFSKGFLG